MDKRGLRVIKGNKIQAVEKKYSFIEACVTNTRLMGVLGLRITWELEKGEIYNQFFHLDVEEFGLDDFMSLTNGSDEEIEKITNKTMGGLGGKVVSIGEREARYLIKTFVARNKLLRQPMPEPEWEYYFIIKEDVKINKTEIKNLWMNICEKIHSYNQLINYFIMRAVGMDFEAMDYLSVQGGIDYKPVSKPSTLLKNTIESMEQDEETSYVTESVVDMGEQYKMVVSEFHIKLTAQGPRVEKAEIKSVMNITSTEAAFALGKKEHLLVYEIKDIWELLRLMELGKPNSIQNAYEAGYLFTEFNPNNDHVDQAVYYLNEDVYGAYFITAAEQLVVAAYSKHRIEEIKNYFEALTFKEIIELEEQLELDNLMLYEFVHSDYDNIYDFLDDDK
ncbi:MAG: hypothetical protein KGZ33_01730 [Alkaliphilus sp.]|nr:hypothetical protein [Alkaliphilus sp.]